jgi:N-acetylneuraminic acid mutarotase
LFVFGGLDGEGDLESCEQYSIKENVWRSIQPMHYKRNGGSVVSFDKIIFVFGGNNQVQGSLDSIERYNLEFDKWTIINLRLKEPVHDTVAFPVGGRRVLIFGGSVADGSANTYWQIYDLTSECLI